MTAPVFRCDPGALGEHVVGASVRLDGPEGRHAATVRRLTAGERVDLVDGRGRRARGTVAAVVGADALDVLVADLVVEPPPAPRLVLVQALPKGDRGELAVELATEAGVDVVVPWAAARCVTRWEGPRGAKAQQRWSAAAAEAAKQSRRSWWPEVRALHGTAEVAALLGTAALGLVLHEGATTPLAGTALPAAGDVVVVVGPEGGLAEEERARLTAAGAVEVRLGETVLRTSTAGVVALAVLSAAGRWR